MRIRKNGHGCYKELRPRIVFFGHGLFLERFRQRVFPEQIRAQTINLWQSFLREHPWP